MASRLLWASRAASYLRIQVTHSGFASGTKRKRKLRTTVLSSFAKLLSHQSSIAVPYQLLDPWPSEADDE